MTAFMLRWRVLGEYSKENAALYLPIQSRFRKWSSTASWCRGHEFLRARRQSIFSSMERAGPCSTREVRLHRRRRALTHDTQQVAKNFSLNQRVSFTSKIRKRAGNEDEATTQGQDPSKSIATKYISALAATGSPRIAWYFDKSGQTRLTFAERLIGLPKRPAACYPVKKPRRDRAIERPQLRGRPSVGKADQAGRRRQGPARSMTGTSRTNARTSLRRIFARKCAADVSSAYGAKKKKIYEGGRRYAHARSKLQVMRRKP